MQAFTLNNKVYKVVNGIVTEVFGKEYAELLYRINDAQADLYITKCSETTSQPTEGKFYELNDNLELKFFDKTQLPVNSCEGINQVGYYTIWKE